MHGKGDVHGEGGGMHCKGACMAGVGHACRIDGH